MPPVPTPNQKPQQSQPQQAKRYLQLKPEDLQRIERAKQADEQKLRVDEEWLMIAEFGKHYGWQAIQAVLNNDISLEVMAMLTIAGRKVDKRNMADASQASFIGSVSAQSKKPVKTFEKAVREIMKLAKADE